jgi:hypothetical protein
MRIRRSMVHGAGPARTLAAEPMEIWVEPPVAPHEELALRRALGVGGLLVPAASAAARGAWSRAAALEAVDNDPGSRGDAEPGYALSPRSTRGATRA